MELVLLVRIDNSAMKDVRIDLGPKLTATSL